MSKSLEGPVIVSRGHGEGVARMGGEKEREQEPAAAVGATEDEGDDETESESETLVFQHKAANNAQRRAA
jgi:hypothetical protein